MSGYWYGSGLSRDVFPTATYWACWLLHCMVYVGESDLWLKGRALWVKGVGLSDNGNPNSWGQPRQACKGII